MGDGEDWLVLLRGLTQPLLAPRVHSDKTFCATVVDPGCWGPHGGNVSQQCIYLLLLP